MSQVYSSPRGKGPILYPTPLSREPLTIQIPEVVNAKYKMWWSGIMEAHTCPQEKLRQSY